MELQAYRICRLRCRLCGTVLSWENRSKSDPGPGYALRCQCGTVGLDPSAVAYRILGPTEAWEDLSEKWEEKCNGN